MKMLTKNSFITICMIIFFGMIFSNEKVYASDSKIGNVTSYKIKQTEKIDEITEKLVSLVTQNKIKDKERKDIISRVARGIKIKLENDTSVLIQKKEKLDPDIYSQNVEDIFDRNATAVDSFDTALISLANIGFEWVKDSIVYKDQSLLINSTWLSYMTYDFGFIRQGLLYTIQYQILAQFGLSTINPAPTGYTKKTLIVPEYQDNAQQLHLSGYYKDNNSDTTIVAVGGFRGNGWPDALNEAYGIETRMLESFGYNVLLTEPRASGESEGQYVTMGYYEKDDYAAFVKDELNKRPNQKIILYGGSMGSSTALGSLKNNYNSQIKAIIALAGFKSIRNELVTILGSLGTSEENIQLILTNLENRYLKPRLHINLKNEVPMEGVSNSVIPKLFLHGDEDNFVLPSNSMDLLMNSAGNKNEFYLISGGNHGNLFNISNPENAQFIKNHIEQFLLRNNLYTK